MVTRYKAPHDRARVLISVKHVRVLCTLASAKHAHPPPDTPSVSGLLVHRQIFVVAQPIGVATGVSADLSCCPSGAFWTTPRLAPNQTKPFLPLPIW